MGQKEYCKQISLACVGSAHSVWSTLGLPQLTAACAFHNYTSQTPGCSAGVLSKVGPAFCALPGSKMLTFMFSGTPQGHRLSGACVLCPSQLRRPGAWQAHSPRWTVCLNHLPNPGCSVSQEATRTPSQVCLVSLLRS